MKFDSKMFFAVGEDQELMIHNSKDKGVIYELYDIVIDKKGNAKRVKVAADKEILWRMAFDLGVLDLFEKRRKPYKVQLTVDEFVRMKHQEVMYGALIVQSDEFFNGWARQYSKNTEKRYRLLMNDFILYLLDYHYDNYLLVDMEVIKAYIDNCIAREKKEKVVLDTLSVLKNLAIEHQINHIRNDFEELREKIKEHLHINKVLYSSAELTFFDWLFELLITKRDEEMGVTEINGKVVFPGAVLPSNQSDLGKFIASRRVRIRRIIYRMIIDLFMNYSDMENLKIKDIHFEEKKLFIEGKGIYIDLDDEMASMLKEYLNFRDKYDYVIYEEKLVKGILLQSRVKLADDRSVDWEDLLEPDVVFDIKTKLLEQKAKEEELEKAKEDLLAIEDKKVVAKKMEEIEGIKERIYEIDKEIYGSILNSKKRKRITQESYVKVDDLFVSVNSRALKSKGMREMISRFIRPGDVKYYEMKERIEMFVFTNEHLTEKERKEDKEHKEFMDHFATLIYGENTKEKENFIDYVKSEGKEEKKEEKEDETEVKLGYQDYNLIKQSAIAALKNEKDISIGEIEKKIRMKL